MSQTLYGQYCPIAVSMDLLGGRWTFLIIRELLDGSKRFNDIHRGVPLMSRTLLTTRLRALEDAKIVTRSRKAEYGLSEGGAALGNVIKSVAMWGQEWLDSALSLDAIDGNYLLWDIRKHCRWIKEMGPRGVALFEFSDWGDARRQHWMVMEEHDTDLCYVDPGYDVNVWVETDLRTMVEVWMGWRPLRDALSSGDMQIDGEPVLVREPMRWMGQSPVAGIAKRPSEARVGKMLENLRR